MNSEQPLISVIVPVYNVRDYLRKCLDSVCAQTYRNLEILVVDDGSTDGSGAICDEYAGKDERIKVIHQKNGGLSAARNSALDVAMGEYVGFIDSDDWAEPELFECLYKTLVENDADISACSYFDDVNGKSIPFLSGGEVVIFPAKASVRELVEDKSFRNAMWNKLFKRDLFDGMRFTVGTCFEDIDILYCIFAKVDKVAFIKQPLYHYVDRIGSITRSQFFDSEAELEHFIVRMKRYRFLLEYDPSLVQTEFRVLVNKGLKIIDHSLLDRANSKNNVHVINTCQRELSTIDVSGLPFSLRMKRWILLNHLNVYRFFYLIFRQVFKSKRKFRKS